jgi:hypothetical protein
MLGVAAASDDLEQQFRAAAVDGVADPSAWRGFMAVRSASMSLAVRNTV